MDILSYTSTIATNETLHNLKVPAYLLRTVDLIKRVNEAKASGGVKNTVVFNWLVIARLRNKLTRIAKETDLTIAGATDIDEDAFVLAYVGAPESG